jgi:ubiquinone/menaquinone biosynthesis C-methylase UbiE
MSVGADDVGDDSELNRLDDGSFISIQAGQMETFQSPPTPAVRQVADVILANVDPFANINECSPEQLDRLATILEVRGAQPRQIKMREACFAAAGVVEGMDVLELGCGTGVVARELARRVGASGRVTGLDVSPALLEHARKSSPKPAPIDYVIGDAYKLAFPVNSFDASCAVTLLAHISNLDQVVREMKRVTRTTVMLLDQDYQTLVFENSDTKLTRKILQHGADYNVLDGWCGRKLPGLLVRHELRNVQCWPFVYSERDARSYLITIAVRFAALALARGIVTPDESKAWLQELYDRDSQNTFYASLNYYFAYGCKRG